MEDSTETPLEKCQRSGSTIYSVTASESAMTATAIDVATAIADQKRNSAPIDAGEESNPAHLVLDREPRDETTVTDRDHLPISPPIRLTETCIPTNLKPDKEVDCEIIHSEESLTPAAHELQQPRVPASITDVTGLVPDKHLKSATAFLDTKPLPAAQLIAPPHRSTPIIKSRVTSRNKETAIEKSIRLGTPVVWKEIHFEKWGRNCYDYTTRMISIGVLKDHIFSRQEVNWFWTRCVAAVFPEGHPRRSSLLQQMNSPAVHEAWEYHATKEAYWARRVRENRRVFRFVKRCNITGNSIGMLAMEDRCRNIVVVPYIGLLSLQSLKYMDIVAGVQGPYIGRNVLRAIWHGVILNIYHYESDSLKAQKLKEADSAEADQYWEAFEWMKITCYEQLTSQQRLRYDSTIPCSMELRYDSSKRCGEELWTGDNSPHGSDADERRLKPRRKRKNDWKSVADKYPSNFNPQVDNCPFTACIECSCINCYAVFGLQNQVGYAEERRLGRSVYDMSSPQPIAPRSSRQRKMPTDPQ